MDLGLTGRVAIVTGASEGLGRGVAEAFVAEGGAVVACSRREDLLQETAEALRAKGGRVVALVGDATDPATPEHLVELALREFGRLDILVANIAGPPVGRALEVDDEALRSALEANFLTTVRLVRACLPQLRAQGWGRIAAIASTSVSQVIPTIALSNVARNALWGWAKTAASDLVGTGVTLNLICPGRHRTARLIAMEKADAGSVSAGQSGDPADFGKVVAFLCSEPAKFITGSAVMVDGGATLAL